MRPHSRCARFGSKVGIDREVGRFARRPRACRAADRGYVPRINRAFNYDGRLRAVYDFRVDWDAFYIYDGVSADEVRSPIPTMTTSW